jgi:hypothetical protein
MTTGQWRGLEEALESDEDTRAAGERFDKAMAARPQGLTPAEIAAIYGPPIEEGDE